MPVPAFNPSLQEVSCATELSSLIEDLDWTVSGLCRGNESLEYRWDVFRVSPYLLSNIEYAINKEEE